MANILSGIVSDATGTPVSGRTVRAYRDDTGALIGSATTTVETPSVVGDPYWDSVVLAMRMNGANGSTTFIDDKSHTVSHVGNAHITTDGGAFGGACGVFDGTDDYLVITTSGLPEYNFSTGNITIEARVFISANSSQSPGDGTRQAIIISSSTTSNIDGQIAVRIDGNSTTTGTGITFFTFVGTVYKSVSCVVGISQSTWHHISVVRSSGVWAIYLDGVAQTVTDTGIGTASIPSPAQNMRIGSQNHYNYPGFINGKIEDVRITKGIARYTSNFTPPTSEMPIALETPYSPLGGYSIDTGAVTSPCTLVFSGEAGHNSLVLAGVTPAAV